MISTKKLRFSSHMKTKVKLQEPPGSARAQPCLGAMELNGGATKVSQFSPPGSEKTSGIHGSQLSKSSG